MTDMVTAPADLAARYGVVETNGLVDSGYHERVEHGQDYTLNELDAAGGTITRLRLLTERGYPFLDISYAHGTLPDGRIVRINLADVDKLRRKSIKGDLIEWAKRQGVFAKRLGLLDEGNWSILRG